ncbi:MAG TPA: oxidoreductase, partial [Anaeromyxobacter sp.]
AAWSRYDVRILAGPASRAARSASLVSLVALALLLAGGALWLLRRRRLAAAPAAPAVETWSCGFAQASARIQYTGSSFAELLLGSFSWAVRPRGGAPTLGGPFPAEAAFHSAVPDPVLDLALVPAARVLGELASRARVLYLRRLIHFQMLLVLVTLVAVLAWGFVW